MGARKRKTGRRSKDAPARQLMPAAAAVKVAAPAAASEVAATPARRAQLVTSASGYRIDAVEGGGGELVTVTAPDGRLCLSIALRPQGPVVEVHAESLHFASRGLLRLDCDRLEVNAASETTLRTGALVQEVAGEVRMRAGGIVDVEADAHRMRSVRGNIALSANDDVSLDGERVLLNSPQPAIRVAPGEPAPAIAAALRATAVAATSSAAAVGRRGPRGSSGSREVTPLFGLPGAPSRRR